MPEDTPARTDRVPDPQRPELQPDEPGSTEEPQPPDGFEPL
ncbi:hypothetical protein ACFXJ8_39505 [Nonomuraea sp. NPDC059194]